ncbi:hypothetical protein CPL00146S_CDS0061 [Escherichia phage SmurfNell]
MCYFSIHFYFLVKIFKLCVYLIQKLWWCQ